MTQEQLNTVVYYIENGEIVESTYKQYLNEFGQDLTTTPRGVADRMHTREIREYIMKHTETGAEIWESEYKELEEDEQGKYNYLGEDTKEWQIWSWGTNGTHPYYTGDSFDNEEDAELYYYERSEWYASEKNWDAPQYFSTEQEAEAYLIQTIADGEGIDFEVAQSIYKKQVKVAARRAELRQIASDKEAKRRAEIKAAVPIEAASITIDDEFKQGVSDMANMSGQTKSEHAAHIMKELLARNGMTAIASDFWQVFRILKARAEK